jgi:DNA-binding response OmpR family regulator
MQIDRKNILIVDSHLGFVFWLGQKLDAAGYVSWPAKSIADAQSLVHEFGVLVDLVIIDYGITGASTFAEDLRQCQGEVKIIGLFGPYEELPGANSYVDSWIQRPTHTSESAGHDYLELIRRELAMNVRALILSEAVASRHR